MDRVHAASSLVVVVDMQERLVPAMDPADRDASVANACLLLDAALALNVAVVATEQYPKGLGPTVAPVASKLRALGAAPIHKLTFDACSEPAFARELSRRAPRTAIVVGFETHVCVFQTVRELLRWGITTWVLDDATASRTTARKTSALRLIERAGGIVAPTETVIFDWLEVAGTERFKQLSKLLR